MLYLTYLVLSPFATAIIGSMVVAYIFYPLYSKLQQKMKNKRIASLIVSLLLIVIIVVPSILLLNAVTKESRVLYLFGKQLAHNEIFTGECTEEGVLCSISLRVHDILKDPQFTYHIEDIFSKITAYLISDASRLLLAAPAIVLNLLIMIFLTYYLFTDGKEIIHKVKGLIPLKKKHQQKILNSFNDTTHGIIYGQIIIAILEGAIGAIAFAIAGVSSPVIWGLAIVLLALIPVVGASVIWIPALIIKLLGGNISAAVIVLIAGIIVSTIELLLKPKIIGNRAKVHPALVLLGVLGGLSFFGLLGFFIGPLILALFITFVRIYEEEKGA